MAYTDHPIKVITSATNKFKVLLDSSGVVPGDLIGPVASSDAWCLARESTSRPAQCVALEPGDSGDTIWVAQAVNIRIADEFTSGAWAENAHCAAGDVGSVLYLGDTAGEASLSVGTTTIQIVGFLTGTNTLTYCPGGYMTTTDITLSGDASVRNAAMTGTLAVTGITTLTGETHTAGGIHIGGTSAPGVDNLVVDGTTTLTGAALLGGTASVVGVATFNAQSVLAAGASLGSNKGIIYGGNPSASATGASLMPGLNVITTGAAGSYILPAYTAGTVVQVATAGAAGSVTIIGPSASCFNTASAASRLVSQAAASEGIVLAAVSATRYAIVGGLTGWNPTN